MSAPAPFDLFGSPLHGVRLIEASAGTGKTWNISGLYLRLLLEQQRDVQQILVVTFTNAATAELRDRIRARIAEVLARLEGGGAASPDPFVDDLLGAMRAAGRDDDAMRARLTRALRSFDEAAIFTIHGFCKRALDDAPFAAGLPLAQELIDDDSALRQEVASDFWRMRVAGADLQPALAAWLLKYKESPEGWAELLRRHGGKPLSRVAWPDDTEAARPIVLPDGMAAAFEHARALWLADRDRILHCVTEALPRLNGNKYRPDTVAAATSQWDDVFTADDAGVVPKGDKLDRLATQSLQPKKGQKGCQEHPFFALAQQLVDGWTSLEQQLERARTVLVRQLVEQGPAQLRERKRGRRVLAFDDMLFNLHERLAAEGGDVLAATLRRRFPVALIDEFQDTDPLQFAIFDRVYARQPGHLLVLVGDPKQAIYSFRNADLHTYLHARKQAQAENTLGHNQRSTPELLRALNTLFTANRRAFLLEGLDYHAVEAGKKARKPFVDTTQPRAALQLWALPSQRDGTPLNKPDAKLAAARACAAEIARLLAAAQRQEVLLDGRPLEAGQVAVLVRSHREGSTMREALLALGLGSVELRQASVFRTVDAQELQTVLLAVAEPGREPLLRAALATELLGLDALQLDALSADESAMLRWLHRFESYRDTWLKRGVAPMLRALMAGESIHARMLRRPDGERRLTNLRHLAELLHAASQQHAGPEALLRWLQRERREPQWTDATQVRLESDRNLVQIVTVHKAKGLEYPVVFCPFLWDGSGGGRGGPRGCEYHADDGTHVIDYRDVKDDKAIKARIRREADAERLRLAYVALTRAVHRCYLVVGGYTKRTGKSASTTECTRNPLNWLVAGEGMDPSAWPENKLTVDDVVAAWARVAQRGDPVVALQPMPGGAGTPVQLPRPAPEQLAALDPPAAIAPGWRIGSYSALAHGVRRDTDGAAADRDLHADAPAIAQAPAPAVAADDILRFPRGARAGESLHAIFERVAFRPSAEWPEAIAATLRFHPPGPGADAAALAPMVQRMLADVTATVLPGGFALRDIAPGRLRPELEFNLSAPSLDTARLVAAMRRHGVVAPPLARQQLQGYLRGFIDLVFEHGGRFHILDWKSNHLGSSVRDYALERVEAAMQAQGYHLQYLLYAVAVHRWLGQRLAGYDYDRHFGAAHYLFVRGVRPDWRNADGSPAGVFHARPPRALVEELDAVIGRAVKEPA